MTYTVACFCGARFSAPATSCPRCGVEVPALMVRPRPATR